MPIHRVRTGSTTNLGSIAHDARAELAPSALPASPASLTPPAAGRVSDHRAATQGRGAKRNGTQAATEPLAAQEQDPRAAKRLRRAEAQQRLAEKRKAARTEKLQETYGISTEEEREALGAGFAAADGKPNVREYRKFIKERKAFAAGFVNPDGKPNVTAYNQHMNERTALNAGFVTADGKPDASAYSRHNGSTRLSMPASSALMANRM